MKFPAKSICGDSRISIHPCINTTGDMSRSIHPMTKIDSPSMHDSPIPVPAVGNADVILGTASFYNQLAPVYDSMTNPEARLNREMPLFRSFIEAYHIQTAMDAGAGTGFHSVLLAKLGVKVTAVDCSPFMLAELKIKLHADPLKHSYLVADLREVSGHTSRSFDAVFCMGNTLAHMETPADLIIVLREFLKVLRPGGTLCIQ